MERLSITKKVGFEMIRGIVEGVEIEKKDELIKILDKEIESLSKRGTSNVNETVNEQIKDMVYEVLAKSDDALKAADILRDETLAQIQYEDIRAKETKYLTVQKLSGLLKQMIEEGRVVKNDDNKYTTVND